MMNAKGAICSGYSDVTDVVARKHHQAWLSSCSLLVKVLADPEGH